MGTNVSGGGGSASTPATSLFPFPAGSGTAATVLSGANKIQIAGFYVPYLLTVTNLFFLTSVQDAVNSYDVGIYDSTGVLKCHVGAQTLPSSVADLPVTLAVNLAVGKYYFAFTGNAATAKLEFPSAAVKYLTNLALVETSTASVGGALPTPIVVPADSWTITNQVLWIGIH